MSEPASISLGIASRYASALFDLAKDDKALKMAADLLHGIKQTTSAPAPTDKASNKAAN